jgi:ABC-type transport system involved in multi-copper enzyme maturation permease subunit
MIARDLARNPIVEKEYRTRMRTWRSSCALMACVLIVGGIGWLIFALISGITARYGQSNAVNYGLVLFIVLLFFQEAVLTFITPALTAGAITGERERQTLDLLLCAPISAVGLLWGKLVGSMAYVVLVLLVLAPVFSLTLLFGGVALHQIVIGLAVTLVSALTIASVGLFFSTVFRRTIPAMVLAYIATFVLVVGVLIGGYVYQWARMVGTYGSSTSNSYTSAILVADVSPAVAFIALSTEDSGSIVQFQTVPDGPFKGWTYWEFNLTANGLLCLCAFAGSTLLLAPGRGAPWRS